MKILIIMDPGITVPPHGYGGHERLVYMFAREYSKLGNTVDLLVTEGSEVEGCKIYSLGKEGFPSSRKVRIIAVFKAWWFLFLNRSKYDVIHNFGRLIYLLPILNHNIKKIMTYGREINSGNINLINCFPNKNLIFTGCSINLISRVNAGGNWKVVYNAIPFENYDLVAKIDIENSPLMFLGRIEKIKGAHTAIKVAKATNNKLILAGNISPLKDEKEYFKKEIEPHLDGEQIKYVGPLSDFEKNKYLGEAKALLFPIEWNEPFGMVMVEAMACGTPVIAFKQGSVDEIINDGLNGFKVNNFNEMVDALKNIELINRKDCRMTAQRKFSTEIIAAEYLSI